MFCPSRGDKKKVSPHGLKSRCVELASSSEPAQLVPLPYSCGRPNRYSYRFHDFSGIVLRCYKDVCQKFLSLHNYIL